MTVSDLKNILEGFDATAEVTVSVAFNDNTPVITADIGIARGENGELTLNAVIYSSDFDY